MLTPDLVYNKRASDKMTGDKKASETKRKVTIKQATNGQASYEQVRQIANDKSIKIRVCMLRTLIYFQERKYGNKSPKFSYECNVSNIILF